MNAKNTLLKAINTIKKDYQEFKHKRKRDLEKRENRGIGTKIRSSSQVD